MKLYIHPTFQALLPKAVDPFSAIMALTGATYRALEGRRTLRFEKNGQTYFIKQHRGVGWREIFKNLCLGRWPTTSAQKEWKALERLKALKILVAEPVAFGERGLNPARRESFLVMRALQHTMSLETLFESAQSKTLSFSFKKALVHRVADIARQLHTHHIAHRDFYLCHFLLAQEAPSSTSSLAAIPLYLIDLHRTQSYCFGFRRWRIKDIAGLYFSSMDAGLTHRDVLRFLSEYFHQPWREVLLQQSSFLRAVKKRAEKLYWKTKIRSSNEILRDFPGRRRVVKTTWQEKSVVAKAFYTWRARGYVRRELEGSRALQAAGILTPAVLYAKNNVIVYDYVPSSLEMNRIWNVATGEQNFFKLVLTIQFALVALHRRGFCYQDPHPHNFLIQGDRVCVIDATNVRRGHHFSDHLKNLVQFYAQIAVRYQPFILEAFQQYCQARSFAFTRALETKMLRQLYRARMKRLSRGEKRSLGNNRTFYNTRSFSNRFGCQKEFYVPPERCFLPDVESYLLEKGFIKRGRTCSVFRVGVQDKKYVVKRYNVKSFWHLLSICWRKSRAEKSWRNTQKLKLLEIATPDAIAFIENRWGFLFHGKSYFVMPWIEGELVYHVLKDPLRAPDEKRAIIAELKVWMRVFREMKIVHGDMKATNFIWHEKRLYLLDLDSLRFCYFSRVFLKGHQKDWQRLRDNWRDQPEILGWFGIGNREGILN
jgi:heptose I phosphotransferase